MSKYLGNPIDHAVDGENNAIIFDFAYPVRKSLIDAIARIRSLHGDDCYLLPMSGISCGSGIFQFRPDIPAKVIGMQFEAPVSPRVRLNPASDLPTPDLPTPDLPKPDLLDIELDEIVIDSEQQLVFCGASVTLEQLNQALAQQLGHCFKVAGADLTSYQYAATGATLMTGGMGPQRRYFSDSVICAAIFDGEQCNIVQHDALQGYAGTYGWSGIVSAVCCRYFRFPQNEIAFALPVSNEPQQLAALLDHLSSYCYLKMETGLALSCEQGSDLILGIEHVSRDSLQPLLNQSAENAIQQKARDLQRKMDNTNAQGLIFVHAMSESAIDDFLLQLLDDADSQEMTLAGIPLEHAEIFKDAEEMRHLREAIPYAARMQAPDASFVYKNHTDANIRLAADEVKTGMQKLWQINLDYVESVEACLKDQDKVQGQILVYGHLNPCGVDPHNRVTISSSDKSAFEQCCEHIKSLRATYYRQLAGLCDQSQARFIGGEKSADSEVGIFSALGGPENCPAELQQKYEQQCRTIQTAARSINWRAIPPYSSG